MPGALRHSQERRKAKITQDASSRARTSLCLLGLSQVDSRMPPSERHRHHNRDAVNTPAFPRGSSSVFSPGTHRFRVAHTCKQRFGNALATWRLPVNVRRNTVFRTVLTVLYMYTTSLSQSVPQQKLEPFVRFPALHLSKEGECWKNLKQGDGFERVAMSIVSHSMLGYRTCLLEHRKAHSGVSGGANRLHGSARALQCSLEFCLEVPLLFMVLCLL